MKPVNFENKQKFLNPIRNPLNKKGEYRRAI